MTRRIQRFFAGRMHDAPPMIDRRPLIRRPEPLVFARFLFQD